MIKKDFALGILGGIALYLPFLFANYLVYFPVLDGKFGL